MEFYRQSMPSVGLSIERCTEAVPPDGYYYILSKGSILGRFKGLKQAQARYRELLKANGYTPPQQTAKVDPMKEAVERIGDDATIFWHESSKHRRRGGKTMYR